MNSTREMAAVVLLGTLLSSTVAAGADSPADQAEIEEQPIEEITVSGRQLSSRDATIIVEQEFVVDVTEALSRLPGADRNQNGRRTCRGTARCR